MPRPRRGRALRRVATAIAATALVALGVALAPSPVAASVTNCGLLNQWLHQCIPDAPRTPITATTLPPGSGPCGGENPVMANGSPWECTFDEEFLGNSLNRNVWTVQTTASGGFHSGAECFVDTPANVSVTGGALDLTVERTAEPFTCAAPGGGYETQYTSGSVYMRDFDQAYGRFEVRARFAAGTVPGLQGSLWLYPRWAEQQAPGGPSEIDIAEAYSAYPDLVMPTVHTKGGGTHNCSVPAYSAAFHTYAVEWSPTAATFYYDGAACFRVAPNILGLPLGGLRSTTPFFVALTQALGIGGNVNTDATPLPATLQVDYVRVWS